jgi:uncharacterized membrane protein
VVAIEIAVSFYYLPKLPDQIPNYVNSQGELINYGSKWLIFSAPVITLILTGLMYFSFQHDKLKDNLLRAVDTLLILYGLGALIIAIFFVQLVMISAKLGDLRYSNSMFFLFGLVVIAVGNRLPTAKRSWFSGIPTPWAMKNDVVWLLTHRLAGFLFMIYGVIIIFSSVIFVTSLGKNIVLLALIAFIIVFIYSYIVYKIECSIENKRKNSNP